jgi:transposase
LCTDLSAHLLPPPLRVETLTIEDHRLPLDVQVTTPTARCPTCAQPASRRQSDYRRTLAELPWATIPVRLHLAVRRFFCDPPSCDRRTFTERVPTGARPYAHTTTRLRQAQWAAGMALGGVAGARQPTSRTLAKNRE